MELYSESIENAVESWKVVQGLPDYKTLVGELLFKEIFKIAPAAVNLYGFGEGVDPYDMPETLFKLPAFQAHTNGVVTTMETALVLMLGKDMETLATALSGLGAKHVTYGIQPPHYVIVESALVRTLELGLGENFTTSLRKDWEAVFRFISRAMMTGANSRVEIVKSNRKTAEQKKVATLRLNAISQSKRSKALTRRSRTGSFDRFEAPGKASERPQQRGRSSDPPQLPLRHSRVDVINKRSHSFSDLPYAHDEMTLWSNGDSSSTGSLTDHDHEDYWSWGNDSNIEPPKQPQRKSTAGSSSSGRVRDRRRLSSSPRQPRRTSYGAPVLIRQNSFDSVSTMGSTDSAPVFPRRSSSPPPKMVAWPMTP